MVEIVCQTLEASSASVVKQQGVYAMYYFLNYNFFFDVFFSPSVLEKHTVESRLSEPQISGCSDYLGGISVGFN